MHVLCHLNVISSYDNFDTVLSSGELARRGDAGRQSDRKMDEKTKAKRTGKS